MDFLEGLKKQQALVQNEGKLKTLQAEAWELFVKNGLPSYMPIKQYPHVLQAGPSVQSHLLPESQSAYLVFVNGCFIPELSRLPEKMVLLPLSKALHTYGAFLEARLCSKQEKDPCALLNLALNSGGVFAYLPPKTRIAAPLQCLHFLTESQAVASPRLQIFLGRESALTLVSTFHTLVEGWVNSALDIHLEEGAQGEQIAFFADEHSCLFESLRATLKQDAQFKTLSLSRGGEIHRQSFALSLNGENAEANLGGISLLRKDLKAQVHVLMEHQAPHTRSRQHFKSVVSERGQASFEGKILVAQAAQKTEAYQLNNNLILGERAQAFSKPNLEIFADDVKASHGATIGQLDEAALFYMRTRGITEAEAQKLLVNAFCEEIGAKISIPSLRERFKGQLLDFVCPTT